MHKIATLRMFYVLCAHGARHASLLFSCCGNYQLCGNFKSWNYQLARSFPLECKYIFFVWARNEWMNVPTGLKGVIKQKVKEEEENCFVRLPIALYWNPKDAYQLGVDLISYLFCHRQFIALCWRIAVTAHVAVNHNRRNWWHRKWTVQSSNPPPNNFNCHHNSTFYQKSECAYTSPTGESTNQKKKKLKKLRREAQEVPIFVLTIF